MTNAEKDMSVRPSTLSSCYARLLRSAPAMSDDERLRAACVFGAACIESGLGVHEVAAMHHRALAEALEDAVHAPSTLLGVGTSLLVDTLVPYDGPHRDPDSTRTDWPSRRRLRTDASDLIAQRYDVVFTADLDGRLTSVSAAGTTALGYPVDALRGMFLAQLLSPAGMVVLDRLCALRRLRGVRVSNAAYRRLELEIVDHDHQIVPIAVHVRALIACGRVVGIQGVARDITAQRQAQAGLRSLHERLEQKVQAISRALHDEAGQLLVSVYLQVDALGADMPAEPDIQDRIVRLRTSLDHVTEELRRLAHDLRPTVLDDLGLDSACHFLADNVRRRSGIQIAVRGSVVGRLASDLETAVYRVVQEAVTNAVKHGRPRSITIGFVRRADRLHGSVRDDGAGFDVGQVLSRRGQRGLGLIGMRERLAGMGGDLRIRSSPGLGTSVVFDVPVESDHGCLSAAG